MDKIQEPQLLSALVPALGICKLIPDTSKLAESKMLWAYCMYTHKWEVISKDTLKAYTRESCPYCNFLPAPTLAEILNAARKRFGCKFVLTACEDGKWHIRGGCTGIANAINPTNAALRLYLLNEEQMFGNTE